MNAPERATGSPAPGSQRGRRVRFAALSLCIAVSATICLLAIDRIGRETARRIDVTATGEHKVAPRTARVLGLLPAGTELIVALDRRTLPPGAVTVLDDVLGQVDRESDALGVSWIDTGSGAGRAGFEATLAKLAARDADRIESFRSLVTAGSAALDATAAAVEATLAPQLESIASLLDASDTARAAFEERAALMRVTARDARAAAANAARIASEPGSGPVPPVDEAWRSLQGPAQNTDTQLDALARELDQYARSTQGTPAARDRAAGVSREAEGLRAALARGIEPLRTSRVPAVIRVARAIEADRAVLAVGPTAQGIVAMDPDALIAAASASAADARRRVEDLAATTLATLLNADPPIVVLVHAESPALLARANLYQRLADHLSRRGIDIVVWSLALSPEPPSLRDLDPDRRRPVLYVALSTDSSAQGPGGSVLPGPERAQRLGRAMTDLFRRGESMLISVSPSMAPTTGSPDPTVAFLAEVGISPDTGRPLVHERLTPAGRIVTTPIAAAAREEGSDAHPLSLALRDLPTFMAWPIALEILPERPADASIHAIYEMREPASWRESQWLGLWQVALENQAAVARPPERDARDEPVDPAAPPALVLAVERPSPTDPGRAQRLIVVGTHSYGQYGWFADPVAHDVQTDIDGRAVPTHPGNLELFDAALAYLSGRDELIAQSPGAQGAPMIRPIDPERLTLIRLALVAGLPISVLLLGALSRVLRRTR